MTAPHALHRPHGAAPDDRLGTGAVVGVGAALAVLCAAALAVRSRIFFTVGFENAGNMVGNLWLALQFATMVAGVIAIHTAPRRAALAILIAEGAVCLVAYGAVGVIYGAGVLAWYGLWSARWLGRARPVLALVGLVALNACGFIGGALAEDALVFSMMFALRLILFAWDRWQNDLERAPLVEYLAYMLPAPLVIVPPYLIIIPVFSGFLGRFRPGLTARGVRQIVRHAGFAMLFGALRGVADLSGIDPGGGVAWLYWWFAANVLAAAAYAHLFIALLLLHGIHERLPLDRPLLTTRFVSYWSRFQVHQKDAQVLLFFTPALLRLRRWNRYVAIAAATTWTMIVGNTLLHLASRYCFLPATWHRVRWLLATNVVIAAALAIEMCIDEWRSRRAAMGLRVGSRLPGWIGWAITMTLAAMASI